MKKELKNKFALIFDNPRGTCYNNILGNNVKKQQCFNIRSDKHEFSAVDFEPAKILGRPGLRDFAAL